MAFKTYFFVILFTSMAFTAIADLVPADTDWIDEIKGYEIKGETTTTPPGEEDKPDAPLPTRVVRLMEDREASEEGPPVVIGMFEDAENVTIRYEKGSIVLERPLGVSLRGSGEKTDLAFDAVNVEVFSKTSERSGMGGGDKNGGGYAPKHLANHPAMPTKEQRQNRDVIGSDQRRIYRDTSYPYSTVGRLSAGGSACTGTMIGPRHVLTAIHCVLGESSSSLTFTPAYYNGDAPFGTTGVERQVHWDLEGFKDGEVNGSGESAFDYVVLVLNRRLGDATGWVGYRTYNPSWNGGKYWDNFGYPGGLTGTRRPVYTLDGAVESTQQQRSMGLAGLNLIHKIDTEGGHSGGPIWGRFTGEDFPRIVGVHVAGATTRNFAAGGDALTSLIEYTKDRYP